MDDTKPTINGIGLPSCSRGDLLSAFFQWVRTTIESDGPVSVRSISNAVVIGGELRRRAVEKSDISLLRDAHTVMNEIRETIATLKSGNRIDAGTTIHLPHGGVIV
ncbi:MAG: hypothetical protein ACREML_00135 [Vulcanimicrobiaceae bacterium]